MLIKKVQIENLRFSAKLQQHSAVVILTTQSSTMCLQGRTGIARGAPRKDIVTGLVSDALRQVRQLPEYRSGQSDIALCHSVTPEPRQSA